MQIPTTHHVKANSIEFEFHRQPQPFHVEILKHEPWFLLNDVCTILNIKSPSDVLSKNLDDDEKLTHIVTIEDQTREINFINESGLFNLIFQSQELEAVRFRKWVISVVLPGIRKVWQNMGIKDILKSAEVTDVAGNIWLPAKEVGIWSGKGRTFGDYIKRLRILEKTQKAKKDYYLGKKFRWMVRKDAVEEFLNLKEKDFDTMNVVNLLNKGGEK